jgi:hypothetical protein
MEFHHILFFRCKNIDVVTPIVVKGLITLIRAQKVCYQTIGTFPYLKSTSRLVTGMFFYEL